MGDDPRAEEYRILRAVRHTGSWAPAVQVRLGDDASDLYPAFYLAPDPNELTFLTLVDRQRGVAEQLGFGT